MQAIHCEPDLKVYSLTPRYHTIRVWCARKPRHEPTAIHSAQDPAEPIGCPLSIDPLCKSARGRYYRVTLQEVRADTMTAERIVLICVPKTR